jgi:hypothetical protein
MLEKLEVIAEKVYSIDCLSDTRLFDPMRPMIAKSCVAMNLRFEFRYCFHHIVALIEADLLCLGALLGLHCWTPVIFSLRMYSQSLDQY